MQDPIEIATDTGARLDALGVAWVTGGSIASSVHGEPRSTQAERTLLRKLEWYRRGGEVSERQWRAVQAIARIQGDSLDMEHLRLWRGD